ncbi:cytosolic Prostaglandin E synthase-like isoform X2 [Tachypleus tridentatus]|uniref:cytosolic Prostaglandin E synthase-like isoform X2 n=1 Tax=Tachypleus tridentatus TaxID=6853 RepID=UPI003FD03091
MLSDIPTNNREILPPPVLWAQRKGQIYLKIALEDCRNPTIKLEKDKLYFRGCGGTEGKDHEITLDFLKEIKPEESKYLVKGREIEFILVKGEEGPYWQRLLKDDMKMMRQMGGLGGVGNNADLDDLDGEPDSDDESLPDLE